MLYLLTFYYTIITVIVSLNYGQAFKLYYTFYIIEAILLAYSIWTSTI
jgi:hypothetical protein